VRIEQRREELTAVRARQKAVRLAERILRRTEFLDDRALHDRE
jgi:hypothetical protein